jgi:hypothetical protein
VATARGGRRPLRAPKKKNGASAGSRARPSGLSLFERSILVLDHAGSVIEDAWGGRGMEALLIEETVGKVGSSVD